MPSAANAVGSKPPLGSTGTRHLAGRKVHGRRGAREGLNATKRWGDADENETRRMMQRNQESESSTGVGEGSHIANFKSQQRHLQQLVVSLEAALGSLVVSPPSKYGSADVHTPSTPNAKHPQSESRTGWVADDKAVSATGIRPDAATTSASAVTPENAAALVAEALAAVKASLALTSFNPEEQSIANREMAAVTPSQQGQFVTREGLRARAVRSEALRAALARAIGALRNACVGAASSTAELLGGEDPTGFAQEVRALADAHERELEQAMQQSEEGIVVNPDELGEVRDCPDGSSVVVPSTGLIEGADGDFGASSNKAGRGANGSGVTSPRPAKAGGEVEVDFWARQSDLWSGVFAEQQAGLLQMVKAQEAELRQGKQRIASLEEELSALNAMQAAAGVSRQDGRRSLDEAEASKWRDRLSRLQADYEQRLSGLRARESAVEHAEMRARVKSTQLASEHDQLNAGAVALTAEADALRSRMEEAMERQATLESWQAGLEKREQAAEDLRDRSRELQEAERQARTREQASEQRLSTMSDQLTVKEQALKLLENDLVSARRDMDEREQVLASEREALVADAQKRARDTSISEKRALDTELSLLRDEKSRLEKANREISLRSIQLRDELKREAQRLSRTEEQNRLNLGRARSDLEREREACKEERTVVADLKRELTESLARAREGRDAMESERSEMLRGFHEVKTDLEEREAALQRERGAMTRANDRWRQERIRDAEGKQKDLLAALQDAENARDTAVRDAEAAVSKTRELEARLKARLEDVNQREEESMRLRSKCDATLANLEREAAEVEGLKQGLDRRHRHAEKEASELATRERDVNRSEVRLAERERQLREREAEQAEALAALEVSRKALEGAAAFVQDERDVSRKTLLEDISRLEKQRQEAQDRALQLEGEVRLARHELTDAASRAKEAEASRDRLDERVKEAEEERQDAMARLGKAEEEAADLKARLVYAQALEARTEAAEKQLSDLRTKESELEEATHDLKRRERLVAEREGAARAWETSLRSEQAAVQQAVLDVGARVESADAREASLKEGESVLARRLEELERLKDEEQRALAEAALEHDAISKDLEREKKRVAQNFKRSAASFFCSRLSCLPRRRLEDAWLRWRLRVLDVATAALRGGEAEVRGRAAQLQASMERGLQELKVGKEGLEEEAARVQQARDRAEDDLSRVSRQHKEALDLKEKAAEDLAETERRRSALQRQLEALQNESTQAQALALALARDKAVLENDRKCIDGEKAALEERRTRLEEMQQSGQAGLEEGRRELAAAVESLEAEKEKLKAASKALTEDRLKAESDAERSRKALQQEKAELQRTRADLDRFSARVGGEKASLRQQRSELEDKHAEMVARENKLRDLDAKVGQARSECDLAARELDRSRKDLKASEERLKTREETLRLEKASIEERARELAAERRELEAREEAVRDTGREVGLSLDQGRNVLGRERNKLKDEAEKLAKLKRTQEAERDDLEMSRADLKERAEALSLRGRELDAREEEVESLRRRAEEESEELERARQACVDMEQELRGRAEAADEREERLLRNEEAVDEARALLEAAREEAVAEARGAEEAAAEARELRAALEETRTAVADKENKARGAEMALKAREEALSQWEDVLNGQAKQISEDSQKLANDRLTNHTILQERSKALEADELLAREARSALSAREETVAAREAEAKEAERKARALEEGVEVRALEAERLRETLSSLEKGLEGEKDDLAKRKAEIADWEEEAHKRLAEAEEKQRAADRAAREGGKARRELERLKKAVESGFEDLQRQELGLEKQKESAREILAAAKVAEAEAAERERTAAETRAELSRSREEVERMRLELSQAMSQVEGKQSLLESSKMELEEEKELLQRGKREAGTEADKLDRLRETLEKREAELHSAEEASLQRSQQLSASFAAERGELDMSRKRAEERASISDGKASALQKELQTVRFALASTERERDQALEAVGELSSKTDSLEEQLEKLGRLLKEAQERTADKARQLQEAERSWDDTLSRSLHESASEVQARENRLKSALQELESSRQELESSRREIALTAEDLEKEREALAVSRARTNELHKLGVNMERELTAMLADKERSEASRAAQEEAWKTQSEQREQEMQELQQRLWEAERLRGDAEGRLEQVTLEASEARAKAAEIEHELQGSKDELERSSSKLSDLQKRHAEGRAGVEAASRGMRELRQELARVEEHAGGLSTRLRQREDELSEATMLIADTRSELTALRERSKEADEEASRNAELTNRVEAAEAGAALLGDELSEAREALRNIEQELLEARKGFTESEGRLRGTTRELRAALLDARQRKEDLENLREETRQERIASSAKFDSMQQELQQQSKKARTEASEWKALAERAEGKLQASVRQRAQLEHDLEANARSEAEARRLTESLSEKSRSLKEEWRALTQEKERMSTRAAAIEEASATAITQEAEARSIINQIEISQRNLSDREEGIAKREDAVREKEAQAAKATDDAAKATLEAQGMHREIESLREGLLAQERDVNAKARAAALREKEISKKSLELSQKQQENSRKAREISQKEGDVSREEVKVSELERRVFQRETGVLEEERRLSGMVKELEGRKKEVDEREARFNAAAEKLGQDAAHLEHQLEAVQADVHTNRERSEALARAERRIQEREKWLEGEQKELDQTKERMSLEASHLAVSIGGVEARVSSEAKLVQAERAHLDKQKKCLALLKTELERRRKALEDGEKALDSRIKHASRKRDAENKAANAELAESRKAVARERQELAARLRGLGEREQRRARETAAEAEAAARKGAEAESLMRRAKERERESVEKEEKVTEERRVLDSERRALSQQRAALEAEASALQHQVAALLERRTTVEKPGGLGETSSENVDLMREAEARLRLAEQRQRAAEEREAAASELEVALTADRRELSLREGALSAAEARAAAREQAAQGLHESLKRAQSAAAAGARSGKPSPSSTGPLSTDPWGLATHTEDNVAENERRQHWMTGGSGGDPPPLRSLAPGSTIPAASPSRSLGWESTEAGHVPGRSTEAAAAEALQEGRERALKARERHLEEWSNALAEQAGAMREQALKLEAAYDQLRRKEEAGDTAVEGGPAVAGLPQGQPNGDEAVENSKGGVAEVNDMFGAVTAGRPATTEDRQYDALSLSTTGTPPAEMTAAPVGVFGENRLDECRRGENQSDTLPPGRAAGGTEQALGRHLEQETVRLAEKAWELEAERRRLTAASEAADRERSRAQAEQKMASDARRDATALRLELEREKARLDAEKGGLAAEKSLLAAERGRLETERARARRENHAATAAPLMAHAGAAGRAAVPEGTAAERCGAGESLHAAAEAGAPPVGSDGKVETGAAAHRNTGASFVDSGGASASVVECAEEEKMETGHQGSTGTCGGGVVVAARNTGDVKHTSTASSEGDAYSKDSGSHMGPAGSVKALVQEMAADLPRRDTTSLTRRTDEGTGSILPRVRSSSAERRGRALREDSLSDASGGSNPEGQSRSVSPRASAGRRRQQQRLDGGDVVGAERVRASSRRNARKGLRADRRWEGGDTRGGARAGGGGVGPSLDSIRRRLHTTPMTRTRGDRQSEGSGSSGGEGEFSSPSVTSMRTPGSRSAARLPSSSPHGRVRGGFPGRSSIPPPRSSDVPRDDREGHRPKDEEGKCPPENLQTPHSLRLAVSSVPTVVGATTLTHEDPFLAQLHARIAGADHTLRQSLDRRQALLSKFGQSGGGGGLSGSVGPSEGEGTTSDFPSVSIDGSPQATASSTSFPVDRATAAAALSTTRADITTGRAGRDARQHPGVPESSPDIPGVRLRFGFNSRETHGKAVATPLEATARRPSPRSVGGEEADEKPSPLEANYGAAEARAGPSTGNVSPSAGEAGREDRRIVSVSGSSVVSDNISPPAAIALNRIELRTPINRGEAARGRTAWSEQASSSRPAEGGAASDTDDTEAEVENLRDLMRALGAVEGDRHADNLEHGNSTERADVPGARHDQHQGEEGRHHLAGGGLVEGNETVATSGALVPWDSQHAGSLHARSVTGAGQGQSQHGVEGAMGQERVGQGMAGVAAVGGGEEEGKGDREGGGGRGGGGTEDAAGGTGEADAGGGDTLMSSLRAQHQDFALRLQDMSLQDALGLSSSSTEGDEA